MFYPKELLLQRKYYFPKSSSVNRLASRLWIPYVPSRIEPDTLQEAMTQWRNGAITNWEYLMRLNGLGGRSYNDLMQYPVLPFVIADYSSRILDLGDPATFRDLSKPMAIQNKSREQHYINTYNVSGAGGRWSSPVWWRW